MKKTKTKLTYIQNNHVIKENPGCVIIKRVRSKVSKTSLKLSEKSEKAKTRWPSG